MWRLKLAEYFSNFFTFVFTIFRTYYPTLTGTFPKPYPRIKKSASVKLHVVNLLEMDRDFLNVDVKLDASLVAANVRAIMYCAIVNATVAYLVKTNKYSIIILSHDHMG